MLNGHVGKPTPEVVDYFIQVPEQLLERTDVSSTAKLLYGVLAGFCRQYGYSKASNEWLAAKLGLKATATRDALRALEDAGLIMKIQTATQRTIRLRAAPSEKARSIDGAAEAPAGKPAPLVSENRHAPAGKPAPPVSENRHQIDSDKTINKRSERSEVEASLFSEDAERDPLCRAAAEYMLSAGACGPFALTRVLDIGFTRAANIIHQLQTCGVISPEDGVQKRRLNPARAALEAAAGPTGLAIMRAIDASHEGK